MSMTPFDKITVTKERKDFLVVSDNHGGYVSGYCFVCGAQGWLDSLQHKEDCPVGLPVPVKKKTTKK